MKEPTHAEMLKRHNRELRKAVDRLASKCGGVALCVVVDDKGQAYGDARIGPEAGSRVFVELFRDLCEAALKTVGAGPGGEPQVSSATIAVHNDAPAAASDTQALDAVSAAPGLDVKKSTVSADALSAGNVSLATGAPVEN